jgi:hypothetical protein
MQDWDPNVEAEEQNRYVSSTKCLLWGIFEGLNDWNIVQLLPEKDNDDKEIQTIHRIVLDAKIKSLCVEEDKIGAFQTDDPDSDGYYLVKWTTKPYRLKEACKLTEYSPSIIVAKGKLVADVVYFNQVPRAPHWYTPAEIATTARLQQVILANLVLMDNEQLPNTYNKLEAKRKGPERYPSTTIAIFWMKTTG